MSDKFVIAWNGVETIQQYAAHIQELEFAAVQMINTTARDTRSEGQRRIMAEINFGSGYLNPAAKRFYVSRKATRAKPEAVITARGRPTSLARFVTANPGIGKEGVSVQVKTGKAQFLKKAFLIKLPAGSGSVETKFNLGLAVRLRPGETLRNKKAVTTRIKSGLFVLYGPSVSQVFIDNSGDGVAKDMEPNILDAMESEFLRLMEWKTSGK